MIFAQCGKDHHRSYVIICTGQKNRGIKLSSMREEGKKGKFSPRETILSPVWARAQFEVTNVRRYVDVYHNNIMHCTVHAVSVTCGMYNGKSKMENGMWGKSE